MTDTTDATSRTNAPLATGSRQISKARRPASQVSRRQTLLWALGLFLVVGGGLASLALVRAGDQRSSVLVLARDVPAGQQLVVEDLTVADVASDDLALVGVDQQISVIGSYTKVRVLAGQPIALNLLQSEPLITSGRVVIAIPVSPLDIPAGVREQSVVDLVITANSAGGGEATAPFVARAVVVQFPPFADAGRSDAALSVEVAPGDAPILVAGVDSISIVLVDPTLVDAPVDTDAAAVDVEVEE
jgi:Chaperone for flagella basal body P-ring formation